MNAALIAAGVPLLSVLFLSFYFQDQLVRHEYRLYRLAWERDGRPTGFFFHPPEAHWFRSSFARTWVSMAWIFQSPDWVQEDAVAASILKRLRLCVLVWNLGCILLTATVLLFRISWPG